MTIKYERVFVTPGVAKAWLARNADNQRNVKIAKVTQYARDMQSGVWNENTGETIKFADGDTETGVLIDGQNRLLAVVESGCSINFDVVSGLPVEAMLVIDSGASRTGGDALRIAGANERMRTASIVRWSIMWDAGVRTGKGGQVNPTNTEIVNRYYAERRAYSAASARGTDCHRMGIGQGRVAGTAFYLFSRIDQEGAHQFFDQYISGANLVPNSGPLLLRNRMAKIKVDRVTAAEQLALFIRAWNAFRRGETMSQLIISRGELTNINFPLPK